MGHFGQELRQERELRGIALESITGVTKISGRHLLALEQEKFDALPGGVLSKGIVRGYVRAVGLDEDAWMNRYLSAYHQSGQLKDDDMSWIEFAQNVGRNRKGDLPRPWQGVRWAGVVLLLTLLAMFSVYVARFVQERSALAAEDLRPPTAALTAQAAATAQPVAKRSQHASNPAAGRAAVSPAESRPATGPATETPDDTAVIAAVPRVADQTQPAPAPGPSGPGTPAYQPQP